MSTTLKMERDDNGPDAYRCDNCERIWTFEQLDNISDLADRVSPGCLVPAGECPDPDETCGGALCYPVEGPAVSADPDANEHAEELRTEAEKLLAWFERAQDATGRVRFHMGELSALRGVLDKMRKE